MPLESKTCFVQTPKSSEQRELEADQQQENPRLDLLLL